VADLTPLISTPKTYIYKVCHVMRASIAPTSRAGLQGRSSGRVEDYSVWLQGAEAWGHSLAGAAPPIARPR
jgi:hypothetical protein